MHTEKLIKLAILNICIAFLEILFFSEGFIGIEIRGTSIFQTALGITIIFMGLIIFILGNYKLLLEKKRTIDIDDLRTKEDCVNALKLMDIRVFRSNIDNILEQIERFDKKKETIKDILIQKFNSAGMSYSKFEGTVTDVENVFYINIKSIINKLNAFDEKDYNFIQSTAAQKSYSKEFIQAKMKIYNEYITFVKEALEDNEQILLKLDMLLLEISSYNSLEDGEIENMNALQEIDDLIKKAELYK